MHTCAEAISGVIPQMIPSSSSFNDKVAQELAK